MRAKLLRWQLRPCLLAVSASHHRSLLPKGPWLVLAQPHPMSLLLACSQIASIRQSAAAALEGFSLSLAPDPDLYFDYAHDIMRDDNRKLPDVSFSTAFTAVLIAFGAGAILPPLLQPLNLPYWWIMGGGVVVCLIGVVWGRLAYERNP